MGYLSDVLIAVAFTDNEHRDEVWAAYCADPRVGKHNLAGCWKNLDTGDYPVLYYYNTDVKWYDDYEDVQGMEHLQNVVRDFAQERGLNYASLYLRIGEELDDMETVRLHTSGPMAWYLDGIWGIERRINCSIEL